MINEAQTTQINARETIGLSMALLRDSLDILPQQEVKAVAWDMAKAAAYIAAGFAWMAVTDRASRLFRVAGR
jgi:hypothetical protein